MLNKRRSEFDEMHLQSEHQERTKRLQMEEDDRKGAREERVLAKEERLKMLSLMEKSCRTNCQSRIFTFIVLVRWFRCIECRVDYWLYIFSFLPTSHEGGF